MSFLEPLLGPVGGAAGGLADFVPFRGGDQHEPIIRTLPKTVKALENKYTDPNVLAYLETLDPSVRRSLVEYDAERAARGANPISRKDLVRAGETIKSGEAYTPAPERNPFAVTKNIHADLGAIAKAIPRLPAAMFSEVKEIFNIGDAVGEIDSPADIFGLPGVRLLPGAYTAQNILGGGEGIKEGLTHPLFTFLDLLPAGRALGVGKAIGKTPIGTAGRAGKAAFQRTRPGQFLRELGGADTRQLSHLEAIETARIQEAFRGQGITDDALTNLTREAVQLRKKYPSLPEERITELTRQMQIDQATIPGLSDVERAFLDDVRLLNDRFAQVGVDEGFLTRIDGEVYDVTTAKGILRARKAADETGTLHNVRQRIETGDVTDLTPDTIRRNVLREGFGKRTRNAIAEGYAHALDAAGYDATPILQTLVKSRGKTPTATMDDVLAQFDEVLSRPPSSTRLTHQQILDTLDAPARVQPRVATLHHLVRTGNYAEALRVARSLSRRKVFTVDGLPESLEALTRLRDRQNFLNTNKKIRGVTEASVRKAEKAAEVSLRKNPPARFSELIEQEVGRRVKGKVLLADTTPENTAKVVQHIADKNYRAIGMTDDEVRAITREVSQTWQDMKAAGHDPIFVHRVTPAQAEAMNFPRALETINKPTQVKARGLNAQPYVEDVTVALSHQGLEWLSRRGAEQFSDTIQAQFGRSLDDVAEMYRPIAERRARMTPSISARAHLDRLVKNEWIEYNPREFLPWRAAGVNTPGVLIPKHLHKTLQRMKAPLNNGFTAAIDPAISAFRLAVLPLSPRWHMYNIFGGGMMLGLEAPGAFRFTAAARELLNKGSVDLGGKVGRVTIPDEIRHALGSVKREQLEFNARSGANLRSLFDQAESARLNKIGQAGGKFGDAFNKVVQKSFDANAYVDDWYRVMAYLEGLDKGLTKGMTREAAEQSAISLSRKILQDWTIRTPLERSIMRFVFPFYGWMSHLARFVSRYPIDHPMRTAVIGSFARAEIEDLGTGLPQAILNSFFLGSPDENGNVKAVSLSGLNPFRDVANYMTLGGFVGQTNPVIATMFEQLGIDPISGTAQLYPNIRYDSETGRLAVSTPNPLQGLVENVIPQSRILFGLMQSGSEFKELLRTNPDAATRLLRSQVGLPVVFRTYNIPQEMAKAEMTRHDAQQNALNEALRTGSDAAAEAFPGLRATLEQIRTLQSQGQLQAYTPPRGLTPLQAAQDAIVRLNAP